MIGRITVSALVLSVIFAGCGGSKNESQNEPAASPSPSGSPSPTVSATPESVSLTGYLWAPFTMPRGKCKDVFVQSLSSNFLKEFQALLAQDSLDIIEKQSITIRDSAGVTIGEATIGFICRLL